MVCGAYGLDGEFPDFLSLVSYGKLEPQEGYLKILLTNTVLLCIMFIM